VVNALAGLCQVFDVSKNEYVLPTIPAVFGVPTLAFLEKNRKKDAPMLEVTVKNATTVASKKIRFIFHSYVPVPAKVMDVPFLLNSGNISSIPVIADAYYAAFDYRSSADDNNAPSEPAGKNYRYDASHSDVAEILTMTPLAALKGKSVQWIDVIAWSTVFVAYPHIFCNYVPSYTEWADPEGVDVFLFRRIQRIFKTGGPNLVAQSSVDATIVMPTLEDLKVIIDDIPPSLDVERDTVINPTPTNPPSDKTGKPNNPVAPLTSPAKTSPSTENVEDSARRITSDGIIIEGTGKKTKAETVSNEPIIDPLTNKAVDDTKFTPSATFWGDIIPTDTEEYDVEALAKVQEEVPTDDESEEDFRARIANLILAAKKAKEKED